VQLKIGQVSKYKVHSDEGDHYELRDIKNNSYTLYKRYTYKKKLVKNQFVHLHTFLERDKELYLSTRIPILNDGDIGTLKVVEVTNDGFFLSNGFERDVFLPIDEKRTFLNVDDMALVKILPSKDNMQRATMTFEFKRIKEGDLKLGSYLKTRVIHIIKREERFLSGVKTVANDGSVVFINKADMGKPPRLNDLLDVRIIAFREDGYLNGSLLAPQMRRRIEDKDLILNYIIANNGVTSLTDKSEPKHILDEVGLSKKAFKKGVGILLSSGKIEIKEHKMWLLD
jgi:hypothetical protein